MRGRLLPRREPLLDIRDVEAFARRVLDNHLPSGMFLQPDEYEDETANILAVLNDWATPVAGLRCPDCQRRRGEQHTPDCPAVPPKVREARCPECGREKARRHERGCSVPPLPVTAGQTCEECDAPDRHARGCSRGLSVDSRYDPTRTASFAQYANFRLTQHYAPEIARRLLGRRGERIAIDRAHSEVDERADSGRRPWEAAPEDSSDLLAGGTRDREGMEAGRVGDEPWRRTILALRTPRRAPNGTRSAQRRLPDAF